MSDITKSNPAHKPYQTTINEHNQQRKNYNLYKNKPKTKSLALSVLGVCMFAVSGCQQLPKSDNSSSTTSAVIQESTSTSK